MYTFVYKTFIKFILFCRGQALFALLEEQGVNALSGLSCYYNIGYSLLLFFVSMPSRAWVVTTLRSKNTSCFLGVNALSGLYLIFTVPLQKPKFYAVSRACFCRYLSEYSDNSRFSCMLTFWTYLMRCTYPWHWIKYSTNYNRCHPIFFTLLISWAEQQHATLSCCCSDFSAQNVNFCL